MAKLLFKPPLSRERKFEIQNYLNDKVSATVENPAALFSGRIVREIVAVAQDLLDRLQTKD